MHGSTSSASIHHLEAGQRQLTSAQRPVTQRKRVSSELVWGRAKAAYLECLSGILSSFAQEDLVSTGVLTGERAEGRGEVSARASCARVRSKRTSSMNLAMA